VVATALSLRYYVLMVNIDEDWLAELGVTDLSEKETDALLDIIEEELEVRVGTKVINSMSKPQLEEFEKLDDEKRESFIDKVFPNYDEVVVQEYNFIGYEITKSKDKIGLIKSWAA
jgi:hypothetical protein